jgi:hypothetical protein
MKKTIINGTHYYDVEKVVLKQQSMDMPFHKKIMGK